MNSIGASDCVLADVFRSAAQACREVDLAIGPKLRAVFSRRHAKANEASIDRSCIEEGWAERNATTYEIAIVASGIDPKIGPPKLLTGCGIERSDCTPRGRDIQAALIVNGCGFKCRALTHKR